MPGGFHGAADRAVLGQLALLASGTIDDARRLEQERLTSLELQRSLLPGVLADYEGISVAARYLASERSNRVGGDWYDVLPLDRHCYAAVVGDVMGHGLREASLMAAMRVAFHAYAIENSARRHRRRVDRLLTRLAPDHLATAVLVVLDVADHHMSIVNAGHHRPSASIAGTPSCSSGVGHCPSACSPRTTAPTPARSRSSPGPRCALHRRPHRAHRPRRWRRRATLLEAIEGFHGTVDELCRLVLLAMRPEHSSDDTCLLAIGID
jgi:hypothetical protein